MYIMEVRSEILYTCGNKFIFLHLVHCGCLKNGITLLTIHSFVTEFYKSYKIMRNNNAGSWKAALEVTTACLHMGKQLAVGL
jgi:hypothetical protein